jgi:hypothetical protein
MTQHRTLVGTLITLAWLAVMLLMYLGAPSAALPTKLNEWGDFFAGFFAPVAFLWLVLGYLQQGQELQLSTKALEMQAQELRNSVDQQRELVELTRRQVDGELEALKEERHLRQEAAKPKFVLGGSGAAYSGGEARYSSSLENVGNTATELTFHFEPQMKYSTLSKMPSLSRGIRVPFEFTYKTPQAEVAAILTIQYIDASGFPGQSKFTMQPVPGNTHNMVEFVANGA